MQAGRAGERVKWQRGSGAQVRSAHPASPSRPSRPPATPRLCSDTGPPGVSPAPGTQDARRQLPARPRLRPNPAADFILLGHQASTPGRPTPSDPRGRRNVLGQLLLRGRSQRPKFLLARFGLLLKSLIREGNYGDAKLFLKTSRGSEVRAETRRGSSRGVRGGGLTLQEANGLCPTYLPAVLFLCARSDSGCRRVSLMWKCMRLEFFPPQSR